MAANNAASINRLRLGILLKYAREKAGVQQKDIAINLGYTGATFLSQVEQGKVPVPPKRAAEFAHHYTKGDKTECVLMTLFILRLSQQEAWSTWVDSICGAFQKDPTQFTARVDSMLQNRLVESGATV